MEIEKILETIGLPEKEARIYLACLKLGNETVYNIAKESGVKRTTAYPVLEKLVERGFASIRKTPKASFYSVISPEKLLIKVSEEREKLTKIIPELSEIYNNRPSKPKVEVYEGRKGVELIYREAGEYLKKGKEVIYFGSTKHFLTEYKDLLDLWVEGMRNKRHKAREILMREEIANSDYAKNIEKNGNPNHQLRYFPRAIKFSDNDNMIYGDKLAIFSIQKELFVILIESKNIADSYRNLFEMAWKVAKK